MKEQIKVIEKVTFPRETVDAVMIYLSSKPYGEVAEIMNKIQTTAELKFKEDESLSGD